VRCEHAELELSARLDGAGDRRLDDELAEHVSACPSCRAFDEGARRIRHAVRLRTAPPVPDLVDAIVDRAELRGSTRDRRRPVAAFVAGAAAAALVFGGLPFFQHRLPAALADEIPERIADASAEVESYRATFDIVERNFHERVPERRMTATVAFVAPERFRAQVTDRTGYPSGDWPRNDLLLDVDGATWSAEGPQVCPHQTMPACPLGTERRAITGREPFAGDAVLPTDVVVPIRTFGGTDRAEVVGSRRVLGRATVEVALDHRDAAPLFAYLQASGSWRPLFPRDRVVVSLDRESWFPLAYEVQAVPSVERTRWAQRNGLPADERGTILSVRATGVDLRTDVEIAPAAPDADTRDAGFRDGALPFDPIEPSDLAGLRPHRRGTSADAEVLVSYARGLSWLKVRQTRSWTTPALYGDVGPLASAVQLPDGGVAYYEPATAGTGRRLSIHAGGRDLHLETNLGFDDLVRVAASLPIDGEHVPDAWLVRRWTGGIVREQVPLERAADAAPYLLMPSDLPEAYALRAIHLVTVGDATGLTAYFARTAREPDGIGLRLHQSADTSMAPPMDPDTFAVDVGDGGRYSPERATLEWSDGGVYRSLQGGAFDLGELVAIARSLEEPP